MTASDYLSSWMASCNTGEAIFFALIVPAVTTAGCLRVFRAVLFSAVRTSGN